MSRPIVREGRAITVVRWIARTWSILNVVLVLAFTIGESLSPHGASPTPIELVGFVFPIGLVVGQVLAWKREGLGGATTIASFAGFYVYMFILRGSLPRGPYFALLAAPGALFLLCWATSRGSTERNPPGG